MCIVLSHFLRISYGAVEEYYSKVETRFYVSHDGILLLSGCIWPLLFPGPWK